MRLVYAVLLPGVIVLTSNVHLLRAHALGADETDVSASDARPSNTAVSDEERAPLRFVGQIERIVGRTFAAPEASMKTSAFVGNDLLASSSVKHANDQAARAWNKLDSQLDRLLNKWRTKWFTKSKNFFNSPEYERMIKLVEEVQRNFPIDGAFNPHEFIVRKFKPEFLRSVIEATAMSKNADVRAQGLQLLKDSQTKKEPLYAVSRDTDPQPAKSTTMLIRYARPDSDVV
ncbi:unnamed protein product [Hyaloperonospora brassicae]|uniref:RxLR effector candidate protein n=1 Tax=Hyaloperonospora brassicae TaxID=162125 RepID=A0AAV0T8Q0_HYABA|nr:unnamed protein product [Hyaloperonospora brassicae]